MALNYLPHTEEDLSRLNVLDPGEYPFVVTSVDEGATKGGTDLDGNPKKTHSMLIVNLKVASPIHGDRLVKDWVVLFDQENPMAFKFRHFAHSCGLIKKYEDKMLEAKDFLNKKGIVKIGMKDWTNQYGEKKKQNSVLDYVKSAQQNNDFISDDIHF